MIEQYELNEKGRDFVVGDIHGCFTKLQQALDKVEFNPEVDRLFSVGDLVDRGPESDQVCDWLAKPWFHAVRGNHDQFIIDFMESPMMDVTMYELNGGKWFLKLIPDARPYYYEEMKKLPLLIEVKTKHGLVGIVHADIAGDDWEDFKKYLEQYYMYALWSRDRHKRFKHDGIANDVKGLHRMYVGHNVTPEVTDIGNVRMIDLGVCFGDGSKEFHLEQFN
jgi:serine/threonine protein phosphatase 1